MGILDLFKKEETNASTELVKSKFDRLHQGLIASFSAVKTDIAKQAEWIGYLHKTNGNLQKLHLDHKDDIRGDVKKINKWISYINSSHKKQVEDFKELENYVIEAVTLYNKHILELYKQVNDNKKDNDLEGLRQNVLTQVRDLLDEYNQQSKKHMQLHKDDLHEQLQQAVKHRVKEHAADIQKEVQAKLKEIKVKEPEPIIPKPMIEQEPKVIHHYSHTVLSNPEQKLLTLLFNGSEPLSYQMISDKTGHSINTVRVNMNSLKKKGLIEENMLPSGVKLFNIKNKEKIKKMYNLEVV